MTAPAAILAAAAALLCAVAIGRALAAFDRFLASGPADEACAAVATALGFAGLAGALGGGCLVALAETGGAP